MVLYSELLIISVSIQLRFGFDFKTSFEFFYHKSVVNYISYFPNIQQ